MGSERHSVAQQAMLLPGTGQSRELPRSCVLTQYHTERPVHDTQGLPRILTQAHTARNTQTQTGTPAHLNAST